MPHSQPTALQQTVCNFHLDPQYHIFHWGSTKLGDSTPCGRGEPCIVKRYLCIVLWVKCMWRHNDRGVTKSTLNMKGNMYKWGIFCFEYLVNHASIRFSETDYIYNSNSSRLCKNFFCQLSSQMTLLWNSFFVLSKLYCPIPQTYQIQILVASVRNNCWIIVSYS